MFSRFLSSITNSLIIYARRASLLIMLKLNVLKNLLNLMNELVSFISLVLMALKLHLMLLILMIILILTTLLLFAYHLALVDKGLISRFLLNQMMVRWLVLSPLLELNGLLFASTSTRNQAALSRQASSSSIQQPMQEDNIQELDTNDQSGLEHANKSIIMQHTSSQPVVGDWDKFLPSTVNNTTSFLAGWNDQVWFFSSAPLYFFLIFLFRFHARLCFADCYFFASFISLIFILSGFRYIMKFFAWNCQGLGPKPTRDHLSTCIFNYKPDILFLSETKSSDQKVQSLLSSLNYPNLWSFNNRGRAGWIALLWKDGFQLELMHYTSSMVNVIIHSGPANSEWVLTCLYSSTYTDERQQQWKLIKDMGDHMDLPWVIIGDFNLLFIVMSAKVTPYTLLLLILL